MKKSIRTLFALMLSAQMVLSFTACGSKKKGTSGASSRGTSTSSTESENSGAAPVKSGSVRTVSENDPYYNVTVSDLKASVPKDKEIQFSDISSHYIVGDRILAQVFVSCKKSDEVQKKLDSMNLMDEKQLDEYYRIESEYSESSLQLFDLNGESIAKIELDPNSNFTGAFAGQNGEILVAVSKFEPKQCASVPGLFVISSSGEKIRDINLSVKEALSDVRIYVTENGNLLLASTGKFYLLDSTGNLIAEETNPELNGMMICSGGKWYAVMPKYTADGTDVFVQEVDIKQGKLIGKAVKTDDSVLWGKQGDRDIFLPNTNGIDKFNVATQERTQVLAWKDTDVNSAVLQYDGASIANENEMVFFQMKDLEAAGRSSMDNKASGATRLSVVSLKKADTNPHAGKTILKLGVNSTLTSNFIERVIAYNQDPANSTRIELCDYTASVSNIMDEDGYKQGLIDSQNNLVMDMLSGNGPDILVGYSDLTQLNTDTMLVDLNPLINADSSINRDDYYDNILRAFEADGKLYTIPLTFSVEGLAINSKYEGAKEQWTFADFDHVGSSLPEDKQLISSNSPEELLETWMLCLSSHFIDDQNKTVDFESEEFKKLLETVKKYGRSSNKSTGPMAAGEGGFLFNDDILFRQDMVACCAVSLFDLQFYVAALPKAGETAIFTGVPSLNGMGMSAKGELSMAITTSCADQQKAWEFIRSFLTEDAQEDLSFNSDKFPINRNVFKKNCATEIEVNNEYIEYMKKEAATNPNMANEPDLYLEFTQEHVDALEKIICSVTSAQSCDNAVMSIILEEVAGYFADQRSVDDVCKNIQNRASLVVQER